MVEAAIEDRDEWRPFCGGVYPVERTAGSPMVCTIPPHDAQITRHLNIETGFSWWETGS